MLVFDHCKGVLLNNKSMNSYRDGHASTLHKEHHEVMEQLVMAVTVFRMVSELLFLSLMMFRSTASVLVNERYDGAQEQQQRDRWGSLLPLWAERGTNSKGGQRDWLDGERSESIVPHFPSSPSSYGARVDRSKHKA